MQPSQYSIGIDLGTATTCVAVYRDGRVEIIPDGADRIMPSYVAFTETGRLIGAAARNQLSINPRNTVFDVLRLLGRNFTDPDVQADMKHLPFRIGNKAGKTAISVDYRKQTKLLTPEEILSMIVTKAKEKAEAYLGSNVESAVVTVPTDFTFHQRQLIRDAALVSGIQVSHLLNGPTAATFTYAFDNRLEGEHEVLVLDLGAGTFDAVLAMIDSGIIEVKATAGDNHLGGEDFDNRLVTLLLRDLRPDLRGNPRVLCRLRAACERAKRELSFQEQVHIEIDSLYDGIDFRYTITRSRFEELCQDLFQSIFRLIERVLRDGQIDKSSVHQVVVSGGSFRIPRLQQMLSDYFNGKDLCRVLNLDEAAASGAAMFAAVRSKYTSSVSAKLNEFLVLDVVPHTLGVGTPEGVAVPLLKRNTMIPFKNSNTFPSSEDDRSSFKVTIFEGEHARTEDNRLIGTFELPLRLKSGGTPAISVVLDCDGRGIFGVTAFEKGEGTQVNISLEDAGRLPSKEIERMSAEAKAYKADEKTEADRISSRNALEAYAYSLKNAFGSSGCSVVALRELAEQVDAVLTWLDENESASAAECDLKQTDLQIFAAYSGFCLLQQKTSTS